MPVGQPEKPIDIRKLVIEEPQPFDYGPFNPAELFDEKKKQELVEKLQKPPGERENEEDYSVYARDLVTMFPQIRDEIDLSSIRNRLNGVVMSSELTPANVRIFDNFKTLFPNEFGALDLDKINRWPILAYLDKSVGSVLLLPSLELLDCAVAFRRLFPDKPLGDLFQDGIWFDEIKDIFGESGFDSMYRAEVAAYARILYPERFGELNLDKRFWQEQREEFTGDLSTFMSENNPLAIPLERGYHLSILAAKEVKITENGMELVISEKQPQKEYNVPPLPEAKRF